MPLPFSTCSSFGPIAFDLLQIVGLARGRTAGLHRPWLPVHRRRLFSRSSPWRCRSLAAVAFSEPRAWPPPPASAAFTGAFGAGLRGAVALRAFRPTYGGIPVSSSADDAPRRRRFRPRQLLFLEPACQLVGRLDRPLQGSEKHARHVRRQTETDRRCRRKALRPDGPSADAAAHSACPSAHRRHG